MSTHIAYIVTPAAALTLFWLARIPLRGAIAQVADDQFTLQAIEDQRRSDYPGCPDGLMQCRAFCDCMSSDRPSLAWVQARAAQLRHQEGCAHEQTRPFRASMFPEFVMGRQCVECRAVNQSGSDKWEVEN